MKQRMLTALASILVLVTGAILASVAFVGQLTQQQQGQLIATLSADNNALREQVIDSGGTPVAPAAEDRIGDAAIGPMGPAGEDGTDGKDGRSVASFSCQTDSTWLITYDDRTTQTVAGPCAAETGPAGPIGPAGPAGTPGAAGAPGEPPASWQFSWLGVDYTCTRDDPFDASAPTYTCNP